MQNKQWLRLCTMIIFSFSLSACDQLMSQMSSLVDTNNVHDCSDGENCKNHIAGDQQQFNWFLEEVKKQ